MIALFSQMLFLVWRLELTFVHTNYQLSKTALICYHITIIATLIGAIILYLYVQASDPVYTYIYYPSQLLRLGVFFCVSYQFMNKLCDLIAMQHSTNININTNTGFSIQDHGNCTARDIDGNYQLLNLNSLKQSNDELAMELAIAMELEMKMGDNSFIKRNHKLISIITKLSLLACLDVITLFVYMTIAQTYSMLYYHEIKLWIIFFYIYSTMEPFSWIIFSLSVWFSFRFSEKEYLCLFGCCHRRFIKYFEKRAKKRAIRQTMAALAPLSSPIYATSTEKSLSAIEILQLQRNVDVMHD